MLDAGTGGLSWRFLLLGDRGFTEKKIGNSNNQRVIERFRIQVYWYIVLVYFVMNVQYLQSFNMISRLKVKR